MLDVWIGKPVEYAYLFTPTELVVMRKPKRFSYPPQAINSVGVSHLTDTVEGGNRRLASGDLFYRERSYSDVDDKCGVRQSLEYT